MKFSGFDWDRGNKTKCTKHGVSLLQIEALFQGRFAIGDDKKHSQLEERFYAVGETKLGRFIFVIFTIRQKEGLMFIRPISARFMHKSEVRRYEKEVAGTKD